MRVEPPSRHTNFGGNQRWHSRRYRPASEAEVLDLLARPPGARIRALGSGHSWSDIAAGTDVSLDMSRMNGVQPFVKDGACFVRVGAGCTLQNLLDTLHATTDQTLPTLGAVKKQTISGCHLDRNPRIGSPEPFTFRDQHPHGGLRPFGGRSR